MSQSPLPPDFDPAAITEAQITEIYNSFNPFRPLEPGDNFYVDCHAVRGNDNIVRELGKKIERSMESTCQLYTGHRGVGKSTELKRLKQYLEGKGCKVIYFASDDDLDTEDTQYMDILLACVRHILEDLQKNADARPVVNWLKARWESLSDLALTEIRVEDWTLETGIGQFARLTATLRQVPGTRQKIRELIDIHSISLIESLNQFIDEAKQKLRVERLVVMVDNLDRIAPVLQENGDTNHETIFIDRSNQLRGLNCHVIYTVPLPLIYSNKASTLRDTYGDFQVLPMIMVQDPTGQDFPDGLAKVQELIVRRVQPYIPAVNSPAALVGSIFESEAALRQLCVMTGGHLREVMQVMQVAMDLSDQFPLTLGTLRQALSRARRVYRDTVDQENWPKLAAVAKAKQLHNEEEYRQLLFSRCVLEYRYTDANGKEQRWHDVHPLLKDVPEFQQAKAKLQDIKSVSTFDQDSPLLKVMNEAEQEYSQLVENKRYGEAAKIAKKIHDMWEEQVESMKHNPKSDDYIAAVAWSSYWHLRYNLYKARS
jgi:AAA ATPase domain